MAYEYVCSHVDEFCIFSRDPELIMKQIKSVFTVKSEGPPEYYLGNDFKKDRKGRWCIACKTYIKEGTRSNYILNTNTIFVILCHYGRLLVQVRCNISPEATFHLVN